MDAAANPVDKPSGTDEPSDNSSQHDDELGLEAGLAGLLSLVAGDLEIEQLLSRIAEFAVQAVPGADGAGVTMLDFDAPSTIVASAPFVRDVDDIQYRIGEGPCISAASSGVTTTSPALGEDEAWPHFGPLAADLGVHSALSLPLNLHGETLGALNVYAYTRHAFGGSSRRIGELFATPTAVAIHNARILDHARKETARLRTALTSRSTIDRAIGIVMSRTGLSEEEAFVRLRIMSQRQHIKVRLVAKNLVAEAVRGARSRTPPATTE